MGRDLESIVRDQQMMWWRVVNFKAAISENSFKTSQANEEVAGVVRFSCQDSDSRSFIPDRALGCLFR